MRVASVHVAASGECRVAWPGKFYTEVFGNVRPYQLKDFLVRLCAYRAGMFDVATVVVEEDLQEPWRQQLRHDGPGRLVLTHPEDEPTDPDMWVLSRGFETWTTLRGVDGFPTIHLCTGPVDASRNHLWDATDSGETVCRRLAQYAEMMGGPWMMTAGVSGHAMIRQEFRGARYRPYWGSGADMTVEDEADVEGDLHWRHPDPSSVPGAYVHGFDMNAARLAAMGVVELPTDKLQRTGAIPFEPEAAGYWTVRVQELFMPGPVGAVRLTPWEIGRHHKGLQVLTTPAMGKLRGLGVNPEVVDSWTARGRRIFRTVAERWNRARTDATLPGTVPPRFGLLAAVKATYRETGGLFVRSGGSIHRPSWYHLTCARQRMTVISRVEQVHKVSGYLPLEIQTDCLYYASDTPDPTIVAGRLGITLGPGLGQFRVASTTPRKGSDHA